MGGVAREAIRTNSVDFSFSVDAIALYLPLKVPFHTSAHRLYNSCSSITSFVDFLCGDLNDSLLATLNSASILER